MSDTAGRGGSGGAGGGLPQQSARQFGAHCGRQLAPHGKAARFAMKQAFHSI